MLNLSHLKSKVSSIHIFEALYLGTLTFILMAFLALPIKAFPLILALQIPLAIFTQKKSSFFAYSAVYISILCTVGIYFSSVLLFALLGLISVCAAFLIQYLYKEKTTKKYSESIFTMLMPFFIVFIIEYMQKNTNNIFRYLFATPENINTIISFHLSYCLTIVFIWVLYCLLSLFFKKKHTVVLTTALPLFLLGLINMVVLHLTSSPLIPSDILIFQTALDVIGEQKVTLELISLAGTSIIFIVLFFCLSRIVNKNSIIDKKRRMIQGLLSTVCIIFLYFFIGSFNMLNFHANYRNGFLYFFIHSAQVEISEPEGYIPLDINTSLPEKEASSVQTKPNVIVIMSEAFSDLSNTYGTKISEDPIPFFHSLQKDFPNGIVYSSVFGNNTVSSEFEFLTGISTGFTTKGSNIYQRYIKSKDSFYSLGQYYDDLGYSTAVFHPASGINYNRSSVYNLLGYDKSIFLEDLSEDTELIRTFVSDKENYNKVTELIEKTKEPLFLMNITMQNHGSYEKEFEISPYITLNGTDEHKDVERYLSLLKKSDDVLKDFINELSSSSEPTVVLFFGDHQPMISKKFYSEQLGKDFNEFSLEDKVITYEVPYLLWSNCDLEKTIAAPQKTSMNYLSLLLNSYIGNPDTDWLSLLRKTQSHYPVITENFVINSDGNIISMDEIKILLSSVNENDEAITLLRKYQHACYSLVVD